MDGTRSSEEPPLVEPLVEPARAGIRRVSRSPCASPCRGLGTTRIPLHIGTPHFQDGRRVG
jgi:hypothetical protein